MKKKTVRFYSKEETAELKAMLPRPKRADIEAFAKRTSRTAAGVQAKLHAMKGATKVAAKDSIVSPRREATIASGTVRIPFNNVSVNFETKMLEFTW